MRPEPPSELAPPHRDDYETREEYVRAAARWYGETEEWVRAVLDAIERRPR